ncbi:MAG: HEAT repeat domain-containing protein [Aggregatilineales bacterium]
MNEAVKDKLQQYDDIMRDVIKRALSKIDKPNRDLIACLHSDSLTLRHTAAQILGEQADHRAISHLLRALDDDSGEVRRAAAWALGQIGDRRAIPGLIRALRDTDNRQSWVVTAEFLEPGFDADGRFEEEKRVCDIAAEALAKIGTPFALRAVVAWRNGYELD